jgi:hypothetical protein
MGQHHPPCQGCGRSGALAERVALEGVLREEVENTAELASAHDYVEGFVWKITLHEGELSAERWAQEVSKRER